MIGTTIAHYRITEKLGEGGMGAVYRAHDSKLDRDVALKILPEQFARSPERLERFQREARVLASLNHPNIGAIHGLEETGSQQALVLELVEGETLAERISRGPVAVEDALKIALQIAEGLEAAHEKGVIHRDLKPGNIMVLPDGLVKLLDFGLAKVLEAEGAAADPENSPTVTLGATRAGVIMGTAGYIAPEQARGKTVDRRADIWAFGVVLYEMLTGRALFQRETVPETLAAVLEREADLGLFQSGVPERVRLLVQRCLVRDPRRRLQAIGDARIEIEDGVAGDDEKPQDAASHDSRHFALSRASLGTVAFLLVCLVALAVWLGRQSITNNSRSAPIGSLSPRLTVDLSNSPLLALDTGPALIGYDSTLVDLSPDGERIVYVGGAQGTTQLYLRELDGFEIRPVPGTEGVIHPFFSPDGRRIGFLTNDKVKTVALDGGSPQVICDVVNPVFGRWTSEETIYVGENEGFQVSRVRAMGGNKETGLSVRGRWQRYSDVLPGGEFALSTHRPEGVSGDQGQVHLISLDSGEAELLVANGYGAKYSPTGHLIYARAGNLYAVGFDLVRRTVRGEPRMIGTGIRMNSISSVIQAAMSLSGLLVYLPGGDTTLGRLAWVDREGETEFLRVPEGHYGDMDIAPDGQRIAVHVHDVQDYIQIYEPGLGETSKIRGETSLGWPVWSRTGSRIASTRKEADGASRVFIHSINSGGPPQTVLESGRFFRVGAWTPDEKRLVAYVDQDTFLIDVEAATGVGEPEPVAQGWGPDLSPDGMWLASSDPGVGVTVRSLDSQQTYQVSQDFGLEVRWCEDCDQLFYREGNRFFASRVQFGPKFQWERPEKVFEVDGFVDTWGKSFDVTPDGERLLVVKRTRKLPRDKIHVIQNWTALLEEKQ